MSGLRWLLAAIAIAAVFLGFVRCATQRLLYPAPLLASRTGVLLLLAQLAVLAGYAIALTADLIVDHRRLDTALLPKPFQLSALTSRDLQLETPWKRFSVRSPRHLPAPVESRQPAGAPER